MKAMLADCSNDRMTHVLAGHSDQGLCIGIIVVAVRLLLPR